MEIQITLYNMLFFLLVGHFLCDYPLQGDWLSKAKNMKLDLVPGEKIWVGAMYGHSLIQSAAVYIITGSAILCLFELIAHFVIDTTKCKGLINYNTDQLLHLICKLVWFGLIFAGVL